MKEIINRIVDATMPGRRIGSKPPKDWTEKAKADCADLFGQLPHDLGMTSLCAFCRANGLPNTPGYVVAFRREAIRLSLIEATERETTSS